MIMISVKCIQFENTKPSSIPFFKLISLLSCIGLMGRVFANGPGDQGSIPGQVIPKTQKKMVLDATLLGTRHHMVWIKSKVE